MNNKNEIFVNENTPVAQPVQSVNRRSKTTSFGVDSDFKTHSPEWDDDKTEVLINTLLPEVSHPLLHESDGTSHTLDHFPYLIGRNSECDLQVKGRAVSRRHAEITLERGRFVLSDLNSENGVTVNGCKISRVLLDDQDEICVGDCVIVFRTTNETLAGKTSDDAKKTKVNASKAVPSRRKIRLLFMISALCVLTVSLFFAGKYTMTANNRTVAVSVPVQSDVKRSTAEVSIQGSTTSDQNLASLEKPSQDGAITSALTNNSTADSIKGAVPNPFDDDNKSTTIAVEKEKTNTASVISEHRTDNKLPPRSLPLQSVTRPAPPPRQTLSVVAAKSHASEVQSADYSASESELIYKEVSEQKTVLVSKTDNVKKVGVSPSALSPVMAKTPLSADKYKEVHKLYEQGNAALAQNKEFEASVLLSKYLDQAKLFWPEQSSLYQKKAIQFLATYYENVATKADQNQDYKLAQIAWKKLFALNKSQHAKSVLDSYVVMAQDMYRSGLRQEYINSAKAMEYWEKTKTLVPPEHPYYIKATEKISTYAGRM